MQEFEKEIIIKNYVKNNPSFDSKILLPVCVYFKGMLKGEEYRNLYFPQFGYLFKNEVPKFMEKDFNKVFWNKNGYDTTPKSDEFFSQLYAKFTEEFGMLELSAVATNINRPNRKVDCDKREDFFHCYDQVNYQPFRDDDGNVLNRIFLFKDSTQPYGENGKPIWVKSKGKYYNKAMIDFINHLMFKVNNYWKPNKSAEELANYMKSTKKGFDSPTANVYQFLRFYKSMEERAVSEKSKEAVKMADKPLTDISMTLSDHFAKDPKKNVGNVCLYERTDKGCVIRVFGVPSHSHSGYEEILRYYISKNSVDTFSVSKAGNTTKTNFTMSIPYGYHYKNVDTILLNPTDVEADPIIGEYYKEFLKHYVVDMKCKEYHSMVGVQGFAILNAISCVRDPFGKKLFNMGLYNLASEYCYGSSKAKFNSIFAVSNTESQASVTERLKVSEEMLKIIDSGLLPFLSKDNDKAVSQYIHFLKLNETKVDAAYGANAAKVFDYLDKKTSGGWYKSVWSSLHYDVSHTYCPRENENFFERIHSKDEEFYNFVVKYVERFVTDEAWCEYYFNVVQRLRKLNEGLQTKHWRSVAATYPVPKFVPKHFDIFEADTIKKLDKVVAKINSMASFEGISLPPML